MAGNGGHGDSPSGLNAGLGWGESQRLTPGERLIRSFMNFIDYNDLCNRLVLEKIRGGDWSQRRLADLSHFGRELHDL